MDLQRGCQMVYFQAKNPTLGKFLRALDFKLLMYFIAVWNICQTFGIFFDHLVHFVFIWYIFPVLEKSGNPDLQYCKKCPFPFYLLPSGISFPKALHELLKNDFPSTTFHFNRIRTLDLCRSSHFLTFMQTEESVSWS
jgi:hypothetical protein